MKWVFLWNGEQHVLEWMPNRFKTDFKPLQDSVMRFVDWKREVQCGYLGPWLEASLGDEVRAWGTITEAFGEIQGMNPEATLEIIESPFCPVPPEAANEEPPTFMDRVKKRLWH